MAGESGEGGRASRPAATWPIRIAMTSGRARQAGAGDYRDGAGFFQERPSGRDPQARLRAHTRPLRGY